jgi:outer membrane protein OmpA-like peptidoglycan-associated protein
MAEAFRPDLEVDVSQVKLSPTVDIGRPLPMPEGPLPAAFRDVLEDVRLPASLSIRRVGQKYVLRGTLPTQAQRDAIIQAVTASGWEADATDLQANSHCSPAKFAEGDALARFVAGFFTSPTPGDFDVDVRNGPRVKALATSQMEAAWLSLLRPVSGENKVRLDITRVPSAFHFPDYKPTSLVPEGQRATLRSLLAQKAVWFPTGSAELPPTESVKLAESLTAMTSAGPEARFIIAGYGDELMEPGSTGRLRVQRVESVRKHLVALGVSEASLETALFDAVRAPGPMTEDGRLEARKVEILLK